MIEYLNPRTLRPVGVRAHNLIHYAMIKAGRVGKCPLLHCGWRKL